MAGNTTYLSLFHVLWHVLKYPQLAAFCMDITGESRPHNMVTTKSCQIDQKIYILLRASKVGSPTNCG